MSRRADLVDPEALTALSDAISRYEERTQRAMGLVAAAINVTEQMLSFQHGLRRDALHRAEAELDACLATVYEDGSRPDCSRFAAVVTAAFEAVEFVEGWMDRVMTAADGYQAAEARTRQSVTTRCPAARRYLETKVATMEQWNTGGSFTGTTMSQAAPVTRPTPAATQTSYLTRGQSFQDVPLGQIEEPSFAAGEWQQADIADMKRSFAGLPAVRAAIANGTIDDLIARDPGAQRVYDWFYGGDAVRLEWQQGRLTISGGKHRVYLAKMLGVSTLPATVFGTP